MKSRSQNEEPRFGRESELLRTWYDQTERLLSSLGDLSEAEISLLSRALTDAMQRLEQRAQQQLISPGLGAQQRLRIRTLGRFDIELDSSSIGSERRFPRKPAQLLQAIIARGGRSVSVGNLSEDLWPDSDGATAIQSLNVTVHRLRKLLVVPETIYVHGGQISINAEHCWVDAWAFEQAVARMGSESGPTAPEIEDSAARFDAAIDLYQGAFLNDEDAPWAAAMRERLRSKFVRAVRIQAARCQQMGLKELTIDIYHRAIEIDPLAEELYRRLMAAYFLCDRAPDAVAVYRRCRIVLGKMLDAAPSPETRELYAQIQRAIRSETEARVAAAAARGFEVDGAVVSGLDTLGG